MNSTVLCVVVCMSVFFFMCGCVYVWGVLVICVLVFTVFSIVCTVFFFSVFRLCIVRSEGLCQ